jgi:lipopolysaccharide transport system permease protein
VTGARLAAVTLRRSARVLRRPRSTPLETLGDAWRNRALLPYYGRRYLERRYARTLLGWVWIPLRPALDVGARVLLFGGFLGVASGDRPYFMFFIVGMAGWTLFDRTAFWATRALEINRSLVSRVRLARLTPVVAAMVPGFVDFLLFFSIGVIGAIYYRVANGVSYLALDLATGAAVVGVGLLLVLGVGFGLWTAPLAADVRDVRFLSRYFFGFLYFLTPVIYPLSTIPERYRPLAELNPITAPIELVKYGFLRTAPPTTTSLVSTAVALLLLLGGGLWFFARSQRLPLERM